MTKLGNEITASFHRGMNFGFAAPRGWYGSPEGLAQIAHMRAANIDWVAAHVTVVQETYASTRIFQDFEHTPADEEIVAWVAEAHRQGIRVMLKPIIEPLDGTWRGIIVPPSDAGVFGDAKPNYRNRFLKSLEHMLVHYAQVAERAGVDAFCLGSEYHRLQGLNKAWLGILGAVRSVYHGAVTNEMLPHDMHERKIYPDLGDWWKELDFLGYSCYPSCKKPGATVDEIVEAMAPAVNETRELAATFGLPVVLAEIGCRSSSSGAGHAAGYTAAGRFDGEAQARYIEAVGTAFASACRGIYWWKWDEHQLHLRPNYTTDPAGDQGFIIRGKPAEAAMRDCYARIAGN